MTQFGIGDIVRVNSPGHALNNLQGKVDRLRQSASETKYFIDFTPDCGVCDTFSAQHLVLVEKNTKIRKRIYYTVNYCATVEYDPETETLEDAISNIDIPEGGTHNSKYQDDSFDAYEVEDA